MVGHLEAKRFGTENAKINLVRFWVVISRKKWMPMIHPSDRISDPSHIFLGGGTIQKVPTKTKILTIFWGGGLPPSPPPQMVGKENPERGFLP